MSAAPSLLRSIPWHETFPYSDLLVCEFQTEQSAVGLSTSLVPESQRSVAEKVSRVAQYIYQKVIRRKPVPYQPSPKEPKYLLCYVEEELECGHKIEIHPGGAETLTARTRNCHECSGWFGGLKLPEGKKPNASILRSYERIKKQAGKTQWWALAVAAFCAVSFISIAYLCRPKLTIWQSPGDEVRVLSQYSPFDFQLQQVHEGVPQIPTVFHFDPKEPQPQFEIGETLSQLIWEQKGEYQSLGSRAMPYKIERDSFGWPKLASNCVNLGVKQPVICDGKPRWEDK